MAVYLSRQAKFISIALFNKGIQSAKYQSTPDVFICSPASPQMSTSAVGSNNVPRVKHVIAVEAKTKRSM